MDRVNTPGSTGHTFDNVYRKLKEIMESITAEEWEAKVRKSRAEEKAYAAYDKIDLPVAPNDEVADIDMPDVEQPFENEPEEQTPPPPPIPHSSNQQQEQQISPNVLVVTPAKPLSCSGCSFETIEEADLRKHMNAIQQCDQCDQSFHGMYAKRRHTQHMKSHVQKPDITCDICGKSFKYQSILKNHKIRSKCGRQ